MKTFHNDFSQGRPVSRCDDCGALVYTAEELMAHVCPPKLLECKPGADLQQPNLWTCYPKAVSIVTGLDYDLILQTIGHDGSRRLDSPGPWNMEAFVQSEMAIAMLKLDWTLTTFYADMQNGQDKSRRTAYPGMPELLDLTYRRPTVVVIQKTGREHALAKTCDNRVIDPRTGLDYCGADPVIWFEVFTPNRRR